MRGINAAVPSAANASGQCASCHNQPSVTAANPIIEPTDKSIPPVIMTGVKIKASKPISTLSLTISKRLFDDKKLFPVPLKIAHSTINAISKAHS